MKKNLFYSAFSRLMTLIVMLVGASTGMVLATAGDVPGGVPEGNLPEGGVALTTGAGGVNANLDGILTETAGRAATEEDDPEFYTKEIEDRILKIRPMSTPIDQISRKAATKETKSFEVKYYSVGTRPIQTKGYTTSAQSSGTSVELIVDDPTIFTPDDTIRVVGVKGTHDENGTPYSSIYSDPAKTPELVLWVVGRNNQNGNPIVAAVNGDLDGTNQPSYVPAIGSSVAKVDLIRMGKACGELDVQTGRFANMPKAEIQYCQNFMIQVEQSTFDQIASKNPNWGFSDLEEDAIYDMRLTQEESYIWGVKGKLSHTYKQGALTWFTGGIWWMVGNHISNFGSYNAQTGETTVTDTQFVDLTKALWVGTGVTSGTKVAFCGSDFLAALAKTQTDRYIIKSTAEVEKWNLTFDSMKTNFGEVWSIHHELMDKNGYSKSALIIDPQYLSKRVHVSFGKSVLDLKKAGVRRTDAHVFQEVSCLYLRYPKAHAIVSLATA